MSRPKYCRSIAGIPNRNCFRPKGIPSALLEEVVLTLDEYEAVRLADFEGLYQEQAAAMMHVSRQTFGRIIATAHRRIADVLINGKALKIEGGEVSFAEMNPIPCEKCCKVFNVDREASDTKICPHCRRHA